MEDQLTAIPAEQSRLQKREIRRNQIVSIGSFVVRIRIGSLGTNENPSVILQAVCRHRVSRVVVNVDPLSFHGTNGMNV